MNRRFLTNQGFAYLSTLGLTSSCLLLSHVLDRMLYAGEKSWPFQALDRNSGPWILLAVVLICLLNAWFFESLLSHFTRGLPHSGTLRGLRMLLSGLPILGFLVLPVWLALVDRPTMAVQIRPRRSRQAALLLSPGMAVKAAPLGLVAVLLVNVLLLQAVLTWITVRQLETDGEAAGLLVLLRLLQGTAFVSTMVLAALLYDPANRLWSAGRAFFALACLLPSPFYWLFATPLALDLLRIRKTQQFLTTAAFTGRTVLDNRLGESLQLDWWRTSRWREWSLPSWLFDPSTHLEEKERRLNLFRVKAFLLIADAGALAALMQWFADYAPLLRGPVEFFLRSASNLCLLLAGLALLVLVMSAGLRLLGVPLPVDFSLHPEAQYLLISMTAFWTGLQCGAALAGGNLQGFGRVVLLAGTIGGIGSVLAALPIPFGRAEARHERGSGLPRFFWGLFLLLLALAGDSIVQGSPHAPAMVRIFTGFGLLSPVWALAVGILAGGRLFHPFTWRDVLSLRLPPAPRLVLLFMGVTVSLPLGGFFIPLWIQFHQRLWPHLIRSHRAYFPPLFTDSTPGLAVGAVANGRAARQPTAPPREPISYAFASLMAHLKDAGRHRDLFRLIEDTPFLTDQAGRSGFRQCAANLIGHALPAAKEESEWERFLHYSLLACNLMGSAEVLADPRVLDILARAGHVDVALDVIGRLNDAGTRAARCAVVAAALGPQNARYRQLVSTAQEELRDLPLPEDAAQGERQFWQLTVIAQNLGSELWPELEILLQQRPPWRDHTWANIVACIGERDGLSCPGFWSALRQVEDRSLIGALLAAAFTELVPDEAPDRVRKRIEEIAGPDDSAFWLGVLSLLGQLAKGSPELALSLWRQWSERRAIPWSIDMVEAGKGLLLHLEDGELDRLASVMEANTAAALRVFLLREGRGGAEAAAEAVAALPAAAERIHWTLRLLAAAHGVTREVRVQGLTSVARELEELEYQVPLPDLRLYLEQVADLSPTGLRSELETIAWAPSFNPELWTEIVNESHCEALLSHLFHHLETLLLASSLSQIAAYQSWTTLTIVLVARLCVLRGDLLFLEKGTECSLDQEALKAKVASALIDAGRLDLAVYVIDGMSLPENILAGRILLRPDSASLGALLAPAPLYQASADLRAVQGEILGILARHAIHEDESLFLEGCLRKIGNHDEQILARLRWTFSLLKERGKKGAISPQLAFRRLQQAVGALESDEALVALLPELVALSSFFGPEHTSREIQNATALLLTYPHVPWPLRYEALERLLREAPAYLLAPGGKSGRAAGPLQVKSLFQELTDGLRGLATLPEMEDHCAQVLPLLLVVAERFPWPVDLDLKELLEEYRTREGVTDDALQVLELCQAAADGRAAETERLLDQEDVSSSQLQALAYLLSGREPERVPEILERLPAGPEKDDVCRRLVRHSWLPPYVALQVCFQIQDRGVRLEADLWLEAQVSAERGDDDWIEDLEFATALCGIDIASGRYEPIVHLLRRTDPDKSRPALADAVIHCLEQGDRQRGETALRLWLQAHLAPVQEQPVQTAFQAFQAARRALSLPGSLAGPGEPEAETLGRVQSFGQAAAFLWRELHTVG